MNPDTFRIILMLARVCVSEGGWEAHDECTVIVHAFVEQAAHHNIPVQRYICQYSPNSCNRRRTDHRRWIAFLDPERRFPPPGWPRQLRWERHRPQFAAMMITAYRAYTGELPSACPGARHWGARWCGECRRRMRNQGWIRAGCGLNNAWLMRPDARRRRI